MLAKKVLPITYNAGNINFAKFPQKKNAATEKRLQRFFRHYLILAGQCLFFLTLNLCNFPRRCGYNPYARIAHIVKQSVKLPPLGILSGGLLHKELIYRDIVTQHKLKEYL